MRMPCVPSEACEQLPLEEAVNKMYLDADQSYNEAKSKCELAEKQMHKAESELKSETKRYDIDKKKYDADHSVADAQKKAAESCKKCGIDALNADTKQALQSLCDDQQKHLTTDISPKITNGEKLEEDLKGLRTEQETATKTLEQMRVASEKAKQAVDGSKAKIENNNRAIAEHNADIAAAIGEVEPLLADSKWKHDWKNEPLLFKKELEQAAADFASKRSQQTSLEAQIEQAQRDNERTANIIKQIQEKASRLEQKPSLWSRAKWRICLRAPTVCCNAWAWWLLPLLLPRAPQPKIATVWTSF
ncbi:MAG: hypothetical protein L6U16_10715 [Porphyromonadaceae bacterium]|nr:MAG: hypothetical protein L6U16_10715 [Porphyromonadaceae bacterium]